MISTMRRPPSRLAWEYSSRPKFFCDEFGLQRLLLMFVVQTHLPRLLVCIACVGRMGTEDVSKEQDLAVATAVRWRLLSSSSNDNDSLPSSDGLNAGLRTHRFLPARLFCFWFDCVVCGYDAYCPFPTCFVVSLAARRPRLSRLARSAINDAPLRGLRIWIATTGVLSPPWS